MKRMLLLICLTTMLGGASIAIKTLPQAPQSEKKTLLKIMDDPTAPRETRDEQALKYITEHPGTITHEALEHAVQNDLTKTVIYLVARQAQLKTKEPSLFQTLTKTAIKNHNVPILQALVDLDAQTGNKSAYTATLVTLLTSIGQLGEQVPPPSADEQKLRRNHLLQMLLFLVDRGADVNAPLQLSTGAETPLSLAASNGDLQPVEFLVSRGASVTPPDNMPLFNAVDYKQKEIIKFLLKKGAQVNQPRTVTLTLDPTTIVTIKKYPLIEAIKGDNPDITIITDLLNAKADPNVRGTSIGQEDVTPLTTAIEGRHEKIALLLLERGAHLPDIVDRRPLIHAVAYALMPELTAQLLKKNAPIVTEKTTGMTPLHDACRQWSIAEDAPAKLALLADVLIKNGVNINAKDAIGNTALHYAISSRWPQETIATLLAHKPDVTIKNGEGKTPLDIAREERAKSMTWDERLTIEKKLREKLGTTAAITDDQIKAAHEAIWDQIIASVQATK